MTLHSAAHYLRPVMYRWIIAGLRLEGYFNISVSIQCLVMLKMDAPNGKTPQSFPPSVYLESISSWGMCWYSAIQGKAEFAAGMMCVYVTEKCYLQQVCQPTLCQTRCTDDFSFSLSLLSPCSPQSLLTTLLLHSSKALHLFNALFCTACLLLRLIFH